MASNRSHRPAGPRAHPGGRGGRVPEGVYRRRRMLALAVVALVALLLLWGVTAAVRAVTGSGDSRPAAGSDAAPVPSVDPQDKFADFTPRPTPSAGGATTDAASPSPSVAEQCGENLGVTASTDKESYSAEQDPVLIMTLENTGDAACEVDAGTAEMGYVVTSGSDTVFDSRHCAAPGQKHRITLEPGQTENARLPWDRVRTAEGCPEDQAEAAAGYYKLTVRLGERESSQALFVLK